MGVHITTSDEFANVKVNILHVTYMHVTVTVCIVCMHVIVTFSILHDMHFTITHLPEQ